MNKDELKTLVRRVNVFGFIITVFFFLTAMTLSVLLIFSFDRRMMILFAISTGVSCLILLPPAALVLYLGFKKVMSTCEVAVLRESSREAYFDLGMARSLETYPARLAAVAFLVGLSGAGLGAFIYYFIGDYNGSFCIYYMILGLALALTGAYLEYHVLYRLMEPLRRETYTYFGIPPGKKGSFSLKTRIIALAALLTITPILIGWVTAVARSTFIVQKDMRARGSENVALLSEDVVEDVREGNYAGLESKAQKFTLARQESVLLLDGSGQIVFSLDTGGGFGAEKQRELLEELEDRGETSVMDRRMNCVAARAEVGDTEYRLVKIIPLPPFMGAVTSIGTFFACIGLLIIGVALLLTLYTSDCVVRPVEELKEKAIEVSGGDLTVGVPVASSDEIGELSESFSRMVKSLREISAESINAAGRASMGATEVSATTEEMQASLQQLSTVIQQLAQNASTEASKADSVYSLTQDIYSALESSTAQADSGVEISRTSSSLAEKGKEDAMNAIGRLSQAKEAIAETERIIESLSELSGEIGVIVEIIDNISDQTNLLALNAAIEAARAQEHGRGFSVVAEEVRKLAEESSKSTSRIAGLVREIQRLASSAVQATHRGAEEVTSGMEATQIVGNSLERIYEFVIKTEELSTLISETSQRHLELGRKALEAMGDIRNIAEANAASSEELSASVEEQTASMQELASTSVELSALAEKMKGLVEKFRI